MKRQYSIVAKNLWLVAAFWFLQATSLQAQTWSEALKAIASDRASSDYFGQSVAIDGDYAVIGAYLDDNSGGTDAGAAYVFERDGSGNWSQKQKLIASDADADDHFGFSVAIDSDYIIVGAPTEDHRAAGNFKVNNAGSAYIFKRGSSTWAEQQKIDSYINFASRDAEDEFGYSVAISGSYAVVGAWQEDHDETGAVGSKEDEAGSAYIFKRSGTTWSLDTKIDASDKEAGDRFGNAVAMSGNYMIVGAYQEDHNVAGTDTRSQTGSAYIFELSGGNWSEKQKIVASDRFNFDEFGYSVAISGTYAIVGAYKESHDAAGTDPKTQAGSAYIFERSGSGSSPWTQAQKLVASDRTNADEFGYSVAISGGFAIVGAYKEDEDKQGANTLSTAGSAYAFKRSSSGNWSELHKIIASDRANGDQFGYAVAVSDSNAIIGADHEGTGSSTREGAAYLFRLEYIITTWNGTSWSNGTPDASTKAILAANYNSSSHGHFAADTLVVNSGIELTIPASGNVSVDRLVNNGTIYLCSSGTFSRNGETGNAVQNISQPVITSQPSDQSVAVGQPATFNVVSSMGGASYNWVVNNAADAGFTTSSFTIPAATLSDNGKIYSVEVSNACGMATSSPALLSVQTSGYTMEEVVKAVASDGASADNLGLSVDIDGNYAIAGAFTHNSRIGAAYIFENDGSGNWTQKAKLLADNQSDVSDFGYSVSISGGRAIVGAFRAPKIAGGPTNFGAAYVYEQDGSGNWPLVQKIVSSDLGGSNFFGKAVSISGNYIVAGAEWQEYDASGNNSNKITKAGAAYIFERTGSGASPWTQVQKIVPSDRAAEDAFGIAVSISGGRAVVGTEGGSNTGAAYVFERSGSGVWSETQKLEASDKGPTFDNFGQSVSISGSHIVVGAWGEDEDASTPPGATKFDAGSAYIFERTGSGATPWAFVQKIVASDRDTDNYFASYVSVSGHYIVAGSRVNNKDAMGNNTKQQAGSAYLFQRTGSGTNPWTQTQKFVASDRDIDDQFGTIAISGNQVISGSPNEGNTGFSNNDGEGGHLLFRAHPSCLCQYYHLERHKLEQWPAYRYCKGCYIRQLYQRRLRCRYTHH